MMSLNKDFEKEMAKISDRKCFESLKRAILQKPCGDTSVVESVFNKICRDRLD